MNLGTAGRALLLVLLLSALQGCADKPPPPNSIEGQYQLFNNLFPHSLDTVHIDVYEDFTCPACQQFANDFEPALMAAYGERVQIRKHYLVGSGSPVSAQILYEVARDTGAGEVASRRLFAAKLGHHDAAKNAPIVEGIAADMGLLAAYNDASSNPDVAKKIRAAWNAEGAHITFFPSIVVENVLLTNSNPENLNTIINSLLKKPMVQVTTTPLADDKVRVRTDQAQLAPMLFESVQLVCRCNQEGNNESKGHEDCLGSRPDHGGRFGARLQGGLYRLPFGRQRWPHLRRVPHRVIRQRGKPLASRDFPHGFDFVRQSNARVLA